jgi:hypothetical protein
MPSEHALDGFAQVLQEVPAIGDLHGLGGTLRRRLGVGRRTVPADHFDPGMGLEPRRDGVRLAVRRRSMTSLRSRSTTMVP